MARSTEEIKSDIVNAVQSDETLSVELTTDSKTSMWGKWAFCVAFCIQTLEQLWDSFRAEIRALLALLKPHTLRWYAQKARDFQYGFNLLADSDQFDNTGYTSDQIAASKVVSYAAVVEQTSPSGRDILRVKVAGTADNELQQLPDPQLISLREYFKRIKDAGVILDITSGIPDKLRQTWDVYYDPLILNESGARIDGSDEAPVREAIKNYLVNLSTTNFNGIYVPTYHVDVVQLVEGVVYPVLKNVDATYGDIPFSAVGSEYQPDAGYLRFSDEDDLLINYIPRSAVQ